MKQIKEKIRSDSHKSELVLRHCSAWLTGSTPHIQYIYIIIESNKVRHHGADEAEYI